MAIVGDKKINICRYGCVEKLIVVRVGNYSIPLVENPLVQDIR
jgi:hypothetical protein